MVGAYIFWFGVRESEKEFSNLSLTIWIDSFADISILVLSLLDCLADVII